MDEQRLIQSQNKCLELMTEFYPDFREMCADFAKDIINRLPRTSEEEGDDGILMTVLLSCLSKEIAHTIVVLNANDTLHMLQRVFLATQAYLPEMQAMLEHYMKDQDTK